MMNRLNLTLHTVYTILERKAESLCFHHMYIFASAFLRVCVQAYEQNIISSHAPVSIMAYKVASYLLKYNPTTSSVQNPTVSYYYGVKINIRH